MGKLHLYFRQDYNRKLSTFYILYRSELKPVSSEINVGPLSLHLLWFLSVFLRHVAGGLHYVCLNVYSSKWTLSAAYVRLVNNSCCRQTAGHTEGLTALFTQRSWYTDPSL